MSDARINYLVEEALSGMRVEIESLRTEIKLLHQELHNAQTSKPVPRTQTVSRTTKS